MGSYTNISSSFLSYMEYTLLQQFNGPRPKISAQNFSAVAAFLDRTNLKTISGFVDLSD